METHNGQARRAFGSLGRPQVDISTWVGTYAYMARESKETATLPLASNYAAKVGMSVWHMGIRRSYNLSCIPRTP